MEKDIDTKSLAKNQVCATFHMRHIQKNVLPIVIKFLWRCHVGVSLRGTKFNIATANQQKHLFLGFPTNV